MSWIKSVMDRYPNVSKGAVSGSLLCLSDLITQVVIQKKQFDWRRNLQFLALGLGWLGPCIQLWYSHLLPKITAKYLCHMKKPKQIFYRLLIDSFVYSPVTYTGFYVFKNVLFNKDDTVNYQSQFKEKFIPTIVADWILWAPVNFINFWWIPIHWQGLYVGVFSFFFNVLLSFIANMETSYDLQNKKQQEESLIKGIPVVHHKQSTSQVVIHKIHPKKIQVIM